MADTEMIDAASVRLSPAAARRIHAILAKEPGAGLRVAVQGGGCSGFQYDIAVAAGPEAEDLIVTTEGAALYVDPVSLEFLRGAEVDWVEELIGASFKIRNPNARSSCGCGVSFSV